MSAKTNRRGHDPVHVEVVDHRREGALARGGRDAAVVTNNIADNEADQGDEVEGNPPPSPEEAVRRQTGAKTTMYEEILAKVRMVREEMVAGWIGPKDAGLSCVQKRSQRKRTRTSKIMTRKRREKREK